MFCVPNYTNNSQGQCPDFIGAVALYIKMIQQYYSHIFLAYCHQDEFYVYFAKVFGTYKKSIEAIVC